MATSDNRRQAVDAIKGYSYQFWQSAFAWISLKENEILFLECKEDFDIQSDSLSIVTQVKDTKGSGNRTLRSPDVIEAINNYWSLRKNQKNSKLFFHFLTTSGIGVEKGAPFGPGIPGLQIWGKSKKDDASLEKLIDFFINENKLDGDLLSYIKSSDLLKVRETLIAPLTWDMENRESEFIEEAVKNKLIIHGSKAGTQPTDSAKVSSRLFKVIASVASKKSQRCLTIVDFYKIFEEETTQPITSANLNSLLNRAINHSAFSTIEGESSSLSLLHSFSPPPLPNKVLPREALINSLIQKLDEVGLINLTGSTGMGKTTIARLIINSNADKWLWVSFRGLTKDQIPPELQKINRTLSSKGLKSIVLDDINFQSDTSYFDQLLGALLYSVLQMEGHVIITSQSQLPKRISINLELNPEFCFAIEPLYESEILEFLNAYGCPSSSKPETWSNLISIKTKGHPQLVHAHINHLKFNNWMPPTRNDILTIPPEVNQALQEVQGVLRDLSSEEMRTLIYRLNTFTKPFRKDQAIKIGEIDPGLEFPGEAFEQLKGPWIEEVSNGYFRLSPLLDNSASNVWSIEKINKIQGKIAEVILKCGNLTQIEAENILLTGLLGKAESSLFLLAQSLLNLPEETLKFLSSSLFWFSLWGIDPVKPLIEGNQHINFFLRLLQLKISSHSYPSVGPKISEAIELETNLVTPDELKTPLKIFHKINKLLLFKIEYSFPDLLNTLIYLSENIPKNNEIFNEEIPFLDKHILERFQCEGDQPALEPILFLFIIERCKSIKDLKNLFSAFEELKIETIHSILNYEHSVENDFRTLIDNAWINEFKKKAPDWPHAISVLESVKSKAITWGSKYLAVHSTRAIAIIKDEHLKKSNEAIELIEKIKIELGDFAALEDELATIYYQQDEFEKALNIWEPLLSSWKPPPIHEDSTPISACRKGAFCACKLDMWDKGAQLYGEGALRSNELKLAISYTGFLFDQGFAFFKSGEHENSLKSFKEGIESLSKLPDPNESTHCFRVLKYAGFIIGWLEKYSDPNNSESLFEPPPGLCSKLEMDERLLNTPLLPVDLFWAYLSQIEFRLTNKDDIFNKCLDMANNSKIPFVKRLTFDLSIEKAFSKQEFRYLPSLYFGWAQSALGMNQLKTQNIEPWEEFEANNVPDDLNLLTFEGMHAFLFPALISLASTGDLKIDSLLKFEKASINEPMKRGINDWLEWAEEIFNLSGNEGAALLKNPSEKMEKRMLAALYFGNSDLIGPEDLFYSHIILFQGFNQSPIKHLVASNLSSIFYKQWLKIIETPALLINPKLTVSDINNACSFKPDGIEKLAGILLAVSNAVNLSVPSEILAQLQNLIN